MKVIIYLWIVIALLACQPQNQAIDEKMEEQKQSTNTKLPSVEVVNPMQRTFDTEIEITGSTKADQTVLLHAMEKGIVQVVNVDIGDRVNKGQTLVQLSNPMLVYENKISKVKIKEAEANLLAAEAGLKMQKTDERIKQGIYERLKKVYDKSLALVTLTDLDNAQRDAEFAGPQKTIALATLDKAKAELTTTKEMHAAIDERVGMLRIKAPFNGIITGRFVDPGALVQNALDNDSAKPIVSLEATTPIRLSLPLPEGDIEGIKIGDTVKVEFPTLPTANTIALISRIAQTLDPFSKTMEVQVDLQNRQGKLKAGMYAKARIKRMSSTQGLSLPHTAILMRKDAPFIMLVSDGIVEEVELQKGISGKNFFEVLNTKVKPNSKVIVKGKSTVKTGQKVNAVLN